jgi:hypothetical protein
MQTFFNNKLLLFERLTVFIYINRYFYFYNQFIVIIHSIQNYSSILKKKKIKMILLES